MKSTLLIQEPFLTIDGQKAPGAGIMLRNHGIEVRTHDVVLRHFRIRVGDDDIRLDDPKALENYKGGTGEHALYFIDGARNCIADHLSLELVNDQNLVCNQAERSQPHVGVLCVCEYAGSGWRLLEVRLTHSELIRCSSELRMVSASRSLMTSSTINLRTCPQISVS